MAENVSEACYWIIGRFQYVDAQITQSSRILEMVFQFCALNFLDAFLFENVN